MLRIRLTRTGRTKQESFRIVVAEHARPVKGKFIEVVGHYVPVKNPKVLELKKDRVEYWMSKGAQPSGTVASLLKSKGFANMEKFMDKRQSNMKKKGEEAKEAAPAGAPAKEKATAPAETPAA